METNNLKINDEVAFNTSNNYFSSAFIGFSKVIKKTKMGMLELENGYRFNKFGNELKSKSNSYPTAYLVELEVAQERVQQDKLINESRKKINDLIIKLNKLGRYPTLSKNQLDYIDRLTDLI